MQDDAQYVPCVMIALTLRTSCVSDGFARREVRHTSVHSVPGYIVNDRHLSACFHAPFRPAHAIGLIPTHRDLANVSV
jgi:hypothetical protein